MGRKNKNRSEFRTPGVLQNFSAFGVNPSSYGERALLGLTDRPKVSDPTLTESFLYKNRIHPVSGVDQFHNWLSQKRVDRQLNKMNDLRHRVINELEGGHPFGERYQEYQEAIEELRQTRADLSANLSKYQKDLEKRFSGSMLSKEKEGMADAIRKVESHFSDILKDEATFMDRLRAHATAIARGDTAGFAGPDYRYEQNGLECYRRLLDRADELNRKSLDFGDKWRTLKSREDTLITVGETYGKDVVRWLPFQKQLSPAETAVKNIEKAATKQNAATNQEVSKRFGTIISKFGLDSTQTKMAQTIIDSSDPNSLKLLDDLSKTNNRPGFLNWFNRESNTINGISQDLKKNAIRLSGTTADETMSIAKNIQSNGPAVAAEMSRLAADEKKASPVIERLKEFLTGKDYKSAIKLAETHPEAKSLLSSTYLKYGGIIGASAAVIAAATALSRKADREKQEAKYSSLTRMV